MLPLVHPSTQQHPLPATPPPLARTSLLVLVDPASTVRPASSSTLSRHRPNTTTYTHAHRHSLAHHRTICIVHPIHSGSAFLPPPSPLHPAGARLFASATRPPPSPTATSSSLRVFRQHVSFRSVVGCNTAPTIALSLSFLASRVRGSLAPRGWAGACGLVGSGAWSDGEAKACVHHPLVPAPIARPASREAIATPATQTAPCVLPSRANKGLVLQRKCGRQWDAVYPSTSPTQLGVAANEKRRPHDACLVTSAWSPKVSIMLASWQRLASLHVEVGRELDLHHLDMVVADLYTALSRAPRTRMRNAYAGCACVGTHEVGSRAEWAIWMDTPCLQRGALE